MLEIEDFVDPTKINISDTFEDVSNWQGKLILANSLLHPDDKIGDWNRIGFISVNKKTNKIIPIPRGDEHNSGALLLEHYGASNDDYFTFFVGDGFIYTNTETVHSTVTFWSTNGGSDNVYINHDNQKTTPTIAQYISETQQLKTLLFGFRDIAEQLRNNPSKRIFYNSYKLTKWLSQNAYFEHVSDYEHYMNKILWARDTEDYTILEQIIFGYPSIKNDVHTYLKSNPNLRGSFGDLDFIIYALGSI